MRVKKKPEITTETPMTETASIALKLEKKPKKPKNYLNNKDMLAELRKSKKDGKMSKELANMLMLLSKRYAEHPWFVNYTYIDDMRSFALLTMVKFWDRFNFDKSNNPFAYFTQIIKRAFQQYKIQEKKHRTIRDLLLVEHGETPSYTFMNEYDEDNYHFDKMDNYEKEEAALEPAPVIDVTLIKEIDALAEEVVASNTEEVSEVAAIESL